MPTEKEALEELEKDTVDTSSWQVDDLKEAERAFRRAEGMLSGVAVPQVDGTLRGWHVTDEPDKVVDLLRTKGDFYARKGDLCGGLYVSAVPHYWEGRSRKKWDFLPKMSREARAKLYLAIEDRLAEEQNARYITDGEYNRAMADMAMARSKDFWQILDIVANQPYNVDIIGIAERLGLAAAFKPPHIPVDFVGRYLEFNTSRAIEANEFLLALKHGSTAGLTRTDLCDMLMGYGWNGVYTKSSMGTNPELVIWSGESIVTFGDYVAQEDAELSGTHSRDFTMSDPTERFVATVKADGHSASITDATLKYVFKDLLVGDLLELRTALVRLIDGERSFKQGKFHADPMYGDRLIDLRDSKRPVSFMGMTEPQVAGLRDLVNKTLEAILG